VNRAQAKELCECQNLKCILNDTQKPALTIEFAGEGERPVQN
jgi:hypothetical protein